tara:strand:+ start:58 stop:513 length:456 start_codon:yes stop_codon:yes gene_type:complete
MAKIVAYPNATSISTDDCLLGTQYTSGGTNQTNPTKNFPIGSVVAAGLGYTAYAALLTQTGTGAPVATILKNDTGATFTWTRFAAGEYRVEADTSIFTANKTAAVFNLGSVNGSSTWRRLSDTFFQIETGTTLSNLDGFLNNGYLEIRIYS